MKGLDLIEPGKGLYVMLAGRAAQVDVQLEEIGLNARAADQERNTIEN
jgi:hypothetical protein